MDSLNNRIERITHQSTPEFPVKSDCSRSIQPGWNGTLSPDKRLEHARFAWTAAAAAYALHLLTLLHSELLVLHAPEKLGLKQEYIQEHQGAAH
jgi:hypothetical protein